VVEQLTVGERLTVADSSMAGHMTLRQTVSSGGAVDSSERLTAKRLTVEDLMTVSS
jgi:hypothetical protein